MRKQARRATLLATVGLVSYLVMLLANFPAALAWSFVFPNPAPITVQAIHGTIWAGRLDAVSYRSLHLNRLAWTLQGWDLLIGRLALTIHIQSPIGTGSGIVSIMGSHHLSLSQAHATLPLDQLTRDMAIGQFTPSGTLHLHLKRLVVDGPAFEVIQGTAQASKITIHSGVPMTLADLRLTAHSAGRGASVIAFQTGPGGSLRIKGRILLGPGRSWRLDARFKPTPRAKVSLLRLLAGYGSPGPHGFYALHLNGILPALSRISPYL